MRTGQKHSVYLAPFHRAEPPISVLRCGSSLLSIRWAHYQELRYRSFPSHGDLQHSNYGYRGEAYCLHGPCFLFVFFSNFSSVSSMTSAIVFASVLVRPFGRPRLGGCEFGLDFTRVISLVCRGHSSKFSPSSRPAPCPSSGGRRTGAPHWSYGCGWLRCEYLRFEGL